MITELSRPAGNDQLLPDWQSYPSDEAWKNFVERSELWWLCSMVCRCQQTETNEQLGNRHFAHCILVVDPYRRRSPTI